MKPDFLIIGAAKAGTTFLSYKLALHPQIYFFPHKEIDFFSNNYDRGFQWYSSKFKVPKNWAGIIGEGSPSYALGEKQVCQRIAHDLPDVKLIYVVRNPLKRIESHYVQLIDNGGAYSSLTEALKNDRNLVNGSLYWERINEYRKYYDDKNILVLFFDELVNQTETVLRECFTFLEIDSTVQIENYEVNRNARSSKMTDYPWMKVLRQWKYFNDAKWLLPPSVLKKLKPFFRKSIEVDVKWDQSLKQEIIRALEEDSNEFLKFYKKPLNYWTLT